MRALFAALLCWSMLALAQAAGPVVVLTQNGAIGPASADYLHRGLGKAVEHGAQLVVLRMDTPGGLDVSMRSIIKDVLASPVPVACFVAPEGARAASAGTYILYASHIAAMAPATNLGAATPVAIGGAPEPDAPGDAKGERKEKNSRPPSAMALKQTNDAAAYIRGLAQMRGRNADWAEKAVREAVSLPAEEALELRVIDLIAADVPELLKKLDGRAVAALGAERKLATADAATIEYQPDWRARLLMVITDPSFAYILLLIGFYGLLFEFYNPGMVAPGVIGGICLLLALFAFQLLPVNYTGLALIVLGIGLLVAEHFVAGFGILGFGGLAAFIIGSIMLIDTDAPGYDIPWQLIFVAAGLSAAFLTLGIHLALRARSRPVVSGSEQMLGASGEVFALSDGAAFARIHGETWQVRCPAALEPGQKVRVVAMDGLLLTVEPVQKGGET